MSAARIQTLLVMVAMGNWGLAHLDGTRQLRVRAELFATAVPS